MKTFVAEALWRKIEVEPNYLAYGATQPLSFQPVCFRRQKYMFAMRLTSARLLARSCHLLTNFEAHQQNPRVGSAVTRHFLSTLHRRDSRGLTTHSGFTPDI